MANDAVMEHKSEEKLSPPNRQCESIESQPPHVNGEAEMANGTVTQPLILVSFLQLSGISLYLLALVSF